MSEPTDRQKYFEVSDGKGEGFRDLPLRKLSEPVKPALTPEAELARDIALVAMAAVCLSKTRFGFTREDVRHLRDVGRVVMANVNVGGVFGYDWCNSIADRIEALLPPAEEK